MAVSMLPGSGSSSSLTGMMPLLEQIVDPSMQQEPNAKLMSEVLGFWWEQQQQQQQEAEQELNEGAEAGVEVGESAKAPMADAASTATPLGRTVGSKRKHGAEEFLDAVKGECGVETCYSGGEDVDGDGGEESEEDLSGLSLQDRQLYTKRRRNREHAKKSRLRKQVMLGTLEETLLKLRRENVRLRKLVKLSMPDVAEVVLDRCREIRPDDCSVPVSDVVNQRRGRATTDTHPRTTSARALALRSQGRAGSAGAAAAAMAAAGVGVAGGQQQPPRPGELEVTSAVKLMSSSYHTVSTLANSQQNFMLTNPNLPDNPLVYATAGFLRLTGYTFEEVHGKNCRFLQGEGTDPTSKSIIKQNIAAGRDTSLCLVNYKKGGVPFWNQLYIGIVRDSSGHIVNHVGVLCEVHMQSPSEFHRLLHRVPLPEALLTDDDDDDGHSPTTTTPSPRARSKDPAATAGAGPRAGASSSAAPAPSTSSADDGNPAAARGNLRRGSDSLRRTRASSAAVTP